MTSLGFKSAWQQGEISPLLTFAADVVRPLSIPDEAKRFLVEIGLPDSAAPFLSFGSRIEQRLPLVTEIWKAGDPRYRMIGGNGSGDPICVDTAMSGRVVFLNHDDDMRIGFMNSSVPQLAYSLLAFRSVVHEAVAVGGDDAYLDGRIPPEVVDRFISKMEEIDSEAIKSERFWFQSIIGEGI